MSGGLATVNGPAGPVAVLPGHPPAAVGLVLAFGVLPGLALATCTWVLLRRHLGGMLGDATAARDYLNVWAAGHLAMDQAFATIFHPGRFAEWLQQVAGPDLTPHSWSYPPSVLFLAMPFALLPLLPGFVAWTVAWMALLQGVLRAAGLPPRLCLALLVSPAVIDNALAGQNGAITAALLEGGLLLLGRRPLVAGALFGLLTTKPQLGILVPVCLVASRNWRATATATAVALLLAVASGLVFGFDSWSWYLTDVRTFMVAQILEQPFSATYQSMLATPFILVRWANGSLDLAYAIQCCVTVFCIAMTWFAWSRPNVDPKARVALTAALAPLASPYAYSYDTIGVAISVAVLVQFCDHRRFGVTERGLLAAAWLWPGLAFWFHIAAIPPVGCLTLAGVAFCAARRLGATPVRESPMRTDRLWRVRLAASTLRRSQGGTVAVMAALMAVPMFGFGALVLDVGLAFTQQTRLRAGTDAAALAAVLTVGTASATAGASLASNNWPAGTLATVATGIYCPDPGLPVASRFTANRVSCTPDSYTSNITGPNAVQVHTASSSPVGLGRILNASATLPITATATATRIDMAGFSAGSGLASLNGGDLNALLSGLFGTNVNLSAASYNGLLDANLDALGFLKALATDAGVSAGTYASLANATVTVGQILAASVTALNAPGSISNSAASAALQLLAAQLPASATIPVSQLINLQPYLNDQVLAPGPAALSAGLNLYGLIASAGQIVGAGTQISVPTSQSFGTSLLGGVVSVGATTVVIQPMQTAMFGFGPVGTTVTTAQVTLGLTMTVSGVPELLYGVASVNFYLPLSVQIAGGTATLTAISCQPGTPTMTIAGRTTAAQIAIGQRGPGGALQPATLFQTSVLGQPVTTVTGVSAVTSGSGPTPQSVTFTQAETEQSPPVVKTVSSDASLISSAAGSIGTLSLTVSGLPGLLPLTGPFGLVQTTLVNTLLPLADTLLDPVINQVLSGLGLRIGYMDIVGNGIRCGVPVLVQ